MCDTCGCGDPEIVSVDVHERILSGNERTAAHNREHFRKMGVIAINLMGSPGAGKTAILEATSRLLHGERLGALAGDLATEHDAERLRLAGIVAKSIPSRAA
jgi:hydrogenase nickel incorporation protein HypB